MTGYYRYVYDVVMCILQSSSSEMLSQCYAHLFNNLIPQHTNLDALLQLWLTLNGEGSSDGTSSQLTFDPSRTPLIALSETSMANMLALVNGTPSMPVCTWVLVFQSLTLLANQKIRPNPLGPEQSMVVAMLADRNLMAVITRFLSGTSEYGPIASAAQFTQVKDLTRHVEVNIHSVAMPVYDVPISVMLIRFPQFSLHISQQDRFYQTCIICNTREVLDLMFEFTYP